MLMPEWIHTMILGGPGPRASGSLLWEQAWERVATGACLQVLHGLREAPVRRQDGSPLRLQVRVGRVSALHKADTCPQVEVFMSS